MALRSSESAAIQSQQPETILSQEAEENRSAAGTHPFLYHSDKAREMAKIWADQKRLLNWLQVASKSFEWGLLFLLGFANVVITLSPKEILLEILTQEENLSLDLAVVSFTLWQCLGQLMPTGSLLGIARPQQVVTGRERSALIPVRWVPVSPLNSKPN